MSEYDDDAERFAEEEEAALEEFDAAENLPEECINGQDHNTEYNCNCSKCKEAVRDEDARIEHYWDQLGEDMLAGLD